MKSILRNPTRKEKRNAHKRACAAAGMPAEDQEAWGSGDPAEREEAMLSEEIEGNDNAEKERLTAISSMSFPLSAAWNGWRGSGMRGHIARADSRTSPTSSIQRTSLPC